MAAFGTEALPIFDHPVPFPDTSEFSCNAQPFEVAEVIDWHAACIGGGRINSGMQIKWTLSEKT
jgi:hypothetical protein